MESNIGKEVIEQIKDFNRYTLTTEQQSLIDKLIPNKELKTRYRFHGLCKDCGQICTAHDWCQLCNSNLFQNWINEVLNKKDPEFAMQYNEAVELHEKSLSIESNTTSDPQAVYTSRRLDFENLPEPQNSKLINEEFYLLSDSLDSLKLDL
ncbi:16124_t:CDS:2 [Funneliformis caledonium]|uniref:16124_t:CDS:1 n=1 Tax=Funneliformis caledonium TaxID=1117310 RepID=A0A9N8WCG3_9GLOM|nr:16124_t:CDS:2 [Funneliformis caledonium]